MLKAKSYTKTPFKLVKGQDSRVSNLLWLLEILHANCA